MSAVQERCNLWPLVNPTGSESEIQDQAHCLAADAIESGVCVSAMLCDAYQCNPTTGGVIARSAFVGELVRLARLATHFQEVLYRRATELETAVGADYE
jgi:hypothetical protein